MSTYCYTAVFPHWCGVELACCALRGYNMAQSALPTYLSRTQFVSDTGLLIWEQPRQDLLQESSSCRYFKLSQSTAVSSGLLFTQQPTYCF